MERKRLIIARFMDAGNNDILWDAFFFSELTERELQEKTEEIVAKFKKRGFRDWDFKDIVEELKKQKLAEEPEFDIGWYEVFV